MINAIKRFWVNSLKPLIIDNRGAVNLRGEIGTFLGLVSRGGPVVGAQQLKMLYGELVLVAGTQSEVLTVQDAEGLSDGYPLIITWHHTFAGVTGSLRGSYVLATRTLTVTSSNAGDTGTASWLVLLPHFDE